MAAKKKEEKETEKVSKETPKEEKTEDTSNDRIAELEKKMSDMGDTINQQNEFIKGASVVINTLAYTPELKKAWETYGQPKVVGDGQVPNEQTQTNQTTQANIPSQSTANEDITRKVTDVETSQRDSIINQFEKEYGIKNLSEDDRKDSRRKIESYLNEFGWSVRNIPLNNLRSNLEKAYLGSNIDKLKEEGKLEGIAQLRANEKGMVGTLSGEEGEIGEEKKDLTKSQAEWAEKLGVDVEGAKEKYLSRDEEYKRPARAEKKEED